LKQSIKHKKEIEQFNPSLYITAELDEEDIKMIKEAFDYYDSNEVGILSPNDLKLALYNQNFHATRETIYSIIAEYDNQGLGGLNFSSFIEIITSKP